jgi:hypothetical protein
MSDRADTAEPLTRRERLEAIREEYTEEIHESRTRAQLAGEEPISRFVAVTSSGSVESSDASKGNLLVADSTTALAELLRQECGEGWLAHGRVWDLDLPWHLWGNLEVSYLVRIGAPVPRPVQVVAVEFREDGTYVFEDPADAQVFLQAVRLHGGRAVLSEEPVNDHRGAELLIDAELARD